MTVDVSSWSETPGSNTTVDGLNIAEGCSPGVLNNAIRAVMAGVKTFHVTYSAFTGTTVTLTGSQTLSNKTLTAPTIGSPVMTGTPRETHFTITDSAGFEIDPANGSMQTIVLGASRTPKGTNFQNGQSVLLGIYGSSGRTVTWTDTSFGSGGVIWVGGPAPTLQDNKWNWVTLWKTGSDVRGSTIGADT